MQNEIVKKEDAQRVQVKRRPSPKGSARSNHIPAYNWGSAFKPLGGISMRIYNVSGS